MNRTTVDGVAVETIARAEACDLTLNLALLRLEPRHLALALGERAQVVRHESADRGAAFGGPDPCCAIDLVGDGDGDVLHAEHGNTGSQFPWKTTLGGQAQ